MPIYEYRCEGCGPFEWWRDHRESGEESSCPECGVIARRVYSAPAFTTRSEVQKEARRMDSGPQPRVVGGRGMGEPSPKPRKAGGRPWQISH